MKSIVLTSLALLPAFAYASAPLPDIVKRFSEQQNITIIKEVDAPGGLKSWVGQ